MQSSESTGCEPLSPHSVHGHLLLSHLGIPATGSLGIGHVTTERKMDIENNNCVWKLQLFTVEMVVFPDLGPFFLSARLVGKGAGAFYSY